jgi:hypothetical protein
VAKKKKSPYQLGSPSIPNPMKEMSWCFKNHIKVNVDPEAEFNGSYWKMTGRYQIVISQGNRSKASGFIYNKDNVMDAVFDAYIKTYNLNYGKEKQV